MSFWSGRTSYWDGSMELTIQPSAKVSISFRLTPLWPLRGISIFLKDRAVQAVTLTLTSSITAFDAFFETDLMPLFMPVVPE